MKLSLLAKSCLCPGLVVLICNLIKSSIDCPKEIENKCTDQNWSWLYEYCCGKGNEIYRVEIPASYCGQQFCNISNDVYKEKGFLLIALEIVVND
jgi:hypothetical protein